MAFLPRVPVEPPVPRGDRYGLIRVANGPIDMPRGADGGGVTFQSIACGNTYDYPVVCGPDDSPGDSPGEFNKTFDFDVPFTNGDPFFVNSTLQCGSVGMTPERFGQRLALKFANGEQTGVERNFAALLAGSGAPELVPDDPTSIVSVVSALEAWVYGVRDVMSTAGLIEGISYEHIAYIHAPFDTAAYAGAEHLVVEGPSGGPSNVKYTPAGSIWVFGGGYPGTMPGEVLPTPGIDAVYITGQVTLWRDPETITAPLRQVFDRGANQWLGEIGRFWTATYECGVAAAAFVHGGESL